MIDIEELLGTSAPTRAQIQEAQQYARLLSEGPTNQYAMHTIHPPTPFPTDPQRSPIPRPEAGPISPPLTQVAEARGGGRPKPSGASSGLAADAIAAIQGNAPQRAAPGFEYGLEAGQMPIGARPQEISRWIAMGIPFEKIAAAAQMMAPQITQDPVTGKQYAILGNGKVVPIGLGLPTQGVLEAEGMKVPIATARDPQTGEPYWKYNLPRSNPRSSQNQNAPSPDSGGDSGWPQQSRGRNPGDIPPSGLGGPFDELRKGLAEQNAFSKERTAGAEEAGKKRTETWAEAIKAGNATYGAMQDLSTMRDAYASNPDIKGGPLFSFIQKGRSMLAQLLPESGIDSLTAPGDVIEKINFGLATKIARELTARPTQMEVAAAMRNNPGLQMNNKGSLYMIDIMMQIQGQKQELGQIAAQIPSDQVWKWPQIEQEFYRTHPLLSPFTGKPLTGNGAILQEIDSQGGLRSSPGGGGNEPPRIEELMPDGTTRPIR